MAWPAPGAAAELAYVPLGLTIATGLLALLGQRIAQEAGVMVALVAAVVIFHLGAGAFGLSDPLLHLPGLLPELPEPSVAIMPALPHLHLGAVDWSLILHSLPLVGAGVLIAVLGHYLNLNAIEMAGEADLDDRRATVLTGMANLGIGGLGGIPAYPSSSTTLSARMMGAGHPAFPLALLVMLGLAMALAADVLAIVPGFVSGGLLLFIGGRVAWQWLVRPIGSLPWHEWLLSALIVAISLVFGILPAVAFGCLAASVLFVVSYGQLPVVRRAGSLAGFRSGVDRAASEAALLDAEAARVTVLQVEGFLFFGTADQLARRMRLALAPVDQGPEAGARTRFLVLDCRRLTGVDAAAVATLERQARRARSQGHLILLAGAPRALTEAVSRRGFDDPGKKAGLAVMPDLERALERVEDLILAGQSAPASDALSTLRSFTASEVEARALQARLQIRDLEPGAVLIRAGERSSEIFLLDQGRLGIYVSRPDGGRLRLRLIGAGSIVGEMALYLGLPRTADVIAEGPARVLVMTEAALADLARDAPAELAAWHAVMAGALADKLSRTTRAFADFS
ncbi:MAG: putative sulfate permease with cyclic nucleotide-binding domain [Cereibacter sp.]|jgi:SulP family sulfate permease|nr:putative sulfate permease with cyclic nucleotide-binding domain [Cereibacter sp.]